MHKGRCSDSYYVLARFLGRIARSIATTSFVFRVYVKLIIDPWIDHLQDHPLGRNPNPLVHILGALHSRSGVAIRHVLRKLQSSSAFKCKGASIIICDKDIIRISVGWIAQLPKAAVVHIIMRLIYARNICI
jgi:hypothetical protein